MQSSEYPHLAFVKPKSYSSGRGGYSVQYLVIHYTAGSERATSAEDGAAYDQRRTDGVSTHYFCDQNSTVQCVYTWDRAHAAFEYGNRYGIQYELCGTAQTRAQWLDPASDATLWQAARQAALDCQKYNLPVRKLSPEQMRAGQKGIGGHDTVTLAYGKGDHMDPGPEFPWDVFLDRVAQCIAPPNTAAAPQPLNEEEDGMVLTYIYAEAKGDKPLRFGLGVVSGGKLFWFEDTAQNLANAHAAATKIDAKKCSQEEYEKKRNDFLALVK